MLTSGKYWTFGVRHDTSRFHQVGQLNSRSLLLSHVANRLSVNFTSLIERHLVNQTKYTSCSTGANHMTTYLLLLGHTHPAPHMDSWFLVSAAVSLLLLLRLLLLFVSPLSAPAPVLSLSTTTLNCVVLICADVGAIRRDGHRIRANGNCGGCVAGTVEI